MFYFLPVNDEEIKIVLVSDSIFGILYVKIPTSEIRKLLSCGHCKFDVVLPNYSFDEGVSVVNVLSSSVYYSLYIYIYIYISYFARTRAVKFASNGVFSVTSIIRILVIS